MNSDDMTAEAEARLKTLVLELGYKGSSYSGFAKQKDTEIATIQGELERALSTLFAHPVETVCAGRTDAGVHARSQFVSCRLPEDELAAKETWRVKKSMNALTADDIVIKRIGYSDEGFSARFDAVRREYRYRICTGQTPPLFMQDFSWWCKCGLDIDAMKKGASYLVGEHDFKTFCKTQSAIGKNTVRTIEEISLVIEEQMGEEFLMVKVVGNAFLHSMIRTIVGTLVQVGKGNRSPGWVREALEAKNRDAAGENAPARGLVFWDVEYKDGAICDQLSEVCAKNNLSI